MGLSYSVEDGRTVVLAEGDFNVEDVRHTFSKVRARSPLPAASRVLIHDRGSSFDPSKTDLRAIADLFEELFGGLSTRIALLVDRNAHQEPGQVLAALSRDRRFDLAFFRELGSAVAWLQR